MEQRAKDRDWGEVIDVLPGLTFKVKMRDGRELLCYVAGRMRMSRVRLVRGDRVEVVAAGDGVRGRITWRG